MKKKPWVRKRHKLWYKLCSFPIGCFLRSRVHYKRKKFKYDRKQNYFIVSNHQTDYDALMMYKAMGRTVYPMTTDSLFSNKRAAKFLDHTFGLIPKRKGAADPKAIKIMLQVAKEGGDVLIFPEGNRTYAEFQYNVDPSIIKLIKKSGLPLMIVNINGGTGVSPRFGNKPRKGHTTLVIKKIVSKEDVLALRESELYNIMMDNLRVYDSEGPQEFNCDYNAEYIERMLYVCPVCGKTQGLRSSGNYLSCDCGLKVEYTPQLRLKSDNPEFKFNILNDWYQFQRKWTREVDIIPDEVIFTDDDIEIYISHPFEQRTLITKGKLTLTDKELRINDFVVNVSDIEMASPISGIKFNFSTKDETYLVIGHPRFNPLKYVVMFNRLETKMKGNDIYYNIYD